MKFYPKKVIAHFKACGKDPRDEMRRLYREMGLSLMAISRMTRIPKNTIQRSLEYWSIHLRSRGGRNHIDDPLLKAIIHNHFFGSMQYLRVTLRKRGWGVLKSLKQYPITDDLLKAWSRNYRLPNDAH